jgi:drug/metabolite transporter (DMT)-like permease
MHAAKSATPSGNTFWWWDKAVFMGGLGVLIFSFSLPATHEAVAAFGGVMVGLGRAVLAAVLAAAVLLARRESLPPRHTWVGLFCVVLGVVIGFPLFSAVALEGTTVAHGAVITGLLPVATAIVAVVRVHERASLLFWISCAAGTVAVLLFTLVQGGGHFSAADWWMIAAVSAGAIGYAEGGRLARIMGGWRVVCWALVLALPFTLVPTAWTVAQQGLHGNLAAWSGLAYVAVFSMFLGFFAWYHGLALGGIARIGQLQLVQPLLTIGWAVLLLGESLNGLTGVTALLVVLCVAVGQRSRAQPIAQAKDAASAAVLALAEEIPRHLV